VAPAERPAAPQLSQREFEEIRELAFRTFGLDLRPGKEEMVLARLSRLVNAGSFASFHDYTKHVSADRSGASLIALVDALTTNHTSFMREPDHFEFFRQRLIPELSQRSGAEIWCAACSSGEEVWTLACIWNEAAPYRNLRIHASDISTKVLARAKNGEYAKDSCAPLPSAWLSRYFERIATPGSENSEVRFRVGARLRSQIEFRRVNLMERFPWHRQFPAIFCRNVMIYFNRETQQKLVQRLGDCLEPGGYLFTGHAESLAGISHQLEYVQPALYRKRGGVGK
jgi:chemotaxis protein methyltransferase CheR